MGLEGWVGIVAGKGVGTRVSLVLLFFTFAMPLAISASEDNPGIPFYPAAAWVTQIPAQTKTRKIKEAPSAALSLPRSPQLCLAAGGGRGGKHLIGWAATNHLSLLRHARTDRRHTKQTMSAFAAPFYYSTHPRRRLSPFPPQPSLLLPPSSPLTLCR